MKKVLILIVAVLLVVLTGCEIDTGTKMMEQTRIAIAEGEYDTAMNYGEIAIKEGCDDEEFLNLMSMLKNYLTAKEAFENSDIDAAENSINKIEDYEGTGMSVSVKSLKKSIEEAKEHVDEYKKDTERIQRMLDQDLYYGASKVAEELLEKEWLTEPQRKTVQEYLNKAEEGKKKDSAKTSSSKETKTETTTTTQSSSWADNHSPKAVFTQEQAIEIARKATSVSENAKITATLINDQYYQISIEDPITSNGETIIDEKSCTVDYKTGEVGNLAG